MVLAYLVFIIHFKGFTSSIGLVQMVTVSIGFRRLALRTITLGGKKGEVYLYDEDSTA